jgi:hypothetical protein
MSPLKWFLHLNMLKSAPKYPELISEVLKVVIFRFKK